MSSDDATQKFTLPRSGLRVRCPHCHNQIELVADAELESIRCESCGSLFSLTSDGDGATHQARGVAQIAHFKLVERLGMGGFGTVWKAHDVELDRTVAIKIPRSGQLDKQRQDYFFREARSAAQLRHPNIVPVHEVGRDGDTLYIVSEFVQGVTLAEHLAGGPVSGREAAGLCAKIADALHHAHEQGVIHRDLKPANVMLDDAGEPHLMDFGLARREANEITMTIDGQVLGTPAYMSPEQAQGEAHSADRRSDLYSLGVMLFEMLTGELPFRGNMRMLIHQVIHFEPPNPRLLSASVPKDLDTLTMKCLEKSPARRFATAEELSAELRRFLSGEPIRSRPVSRTERAWRWCRRKPVVAGLSAAVAALLLVLAVGGPAVALRQSRLRQAAERNELTANRATRQAEASAAAARTSEAAARQSEAAAQQSQRETEEAYATLKNESARILFNHGTTEYAAGRLAAGCDELFRAWTMCTDGNPLKPAYQRVLFDRLTRGGRSPVAIPRSYAPVAFSPDGRRIVVCTDDDAARVFDAATGQPVGKPMRHENLMKTARKLFAEGSNPDTLGKVKFYLPTISVITFSNDGKFVLTAERGGAIRRWDAASGELVGKPLYFEGMQAVDFSGDGRRAAVGDAERIARIVDLDSGKPVGEMMRHAGPVRTVKFSPDQRRILSSYDKTAYLWDGETGKAVGAPVAHENQLSVVAFSPDSRRFVTSSLDKTTKVWDAATGSAIGQPLQRDHFATAFAFHPDSRRAVVTSNDTARIWDSNTGALSGAPMVHQGRIFAAAFSPDGKRLYTAAEDRTVRTWEVATGTPLGEPLQHDAVGSLTLSPDGRLLASSDSGTVRIWDLNAGRMLGEPLVAATVREEWPFCAAISPDGKRLVAGAMDGALRQWDVATRKPLGVLARHGGPVYEVNFTPDGRLLLTASADKTARIWDAKTGAPVGKPFRHTDLVNCIALSPDGERVCTGSTDRTAQLWNAVSGERIGKPMQFGAEVKSAAFSPDGRRVFVGSDDGTARMFDALTGAFLGLAVETESRTPSVAFSQDGRRVLTASWNQAVRLWDATTLEPLGEPMRHSNRVFTAVISPDEERVLTGDDGGNVRTWDAMTGVPLGETWRHTSEVGTAVFSPDGAFLVTKPNDKTICFWDASRVPTPQDSLAWIELQLGKRVDETGELTPLTAEQIAERSEQIDQDREWIEKMHAIQSVGQR